MRVVSAAGRIAEVRLYDLFGEDWWTGEGLTSKSVSRDLDRQKPFDALRVRINSPGGVVDEGIAIYNVLRSHGVPVTVHVDSIAASIASVIMLAGDVRYIARNAVVMIHDPMGGCIGTADDMRKYSEILDTRRNQILGTYVDRTGGNLSQLSAWMSEEKWFDADEACVAGFATSIDPVDELAEVATLRPMNLSRLGYRRVPAEVARRVSGLDALEARARVHGAKVARFRTTGEGRCQ